jgi:hypothetical protein
MGVGPLNAYAVHALLGVRDGQSHEATIEARDLDDALDKIRRVAESQPHFIAVTLMHVEDLPGTLEGAETLGRLTL